MAWPRGADGAIEVTVTDDNGDPVNLTGTSVALGFRASDNAPYPLFVRTGVLTDAFNGKFTCFLNAADTGGLATGAYRYDGWLTNSDGRHQIIKSSVFMIVEADTRPGDGESAATPIPPMVNGHVDTVNTTGTKLSAVDASQLGPGFLMYVIEKDAYYRIRVGQHMTVDHDLVETALGLTDGQWEQYVSGSGGGPGIALVPFEDVGPIQSTNVSGGEDVIPIPRYFDFDDFTVSAFLARITASAKVSGGTGTIRIRQGGTLGLADGTVLATGTLTGTSYAPVNFVSGSLPPASGLQLLQITLQNNTVGQSTFVQGAMLALVPQGGGGGGGGGSGTVTAVGSADGSVIVKNPATTPDLSVLAVASWPALNIRVYAVDGVNGNDSNVGFADATGPSTGQYATACQAAGAVAKKTIAGLAAIFPRVGNGRLVEIVIANGGVNTIGTYADSLGSVISGATGYRALLARGTGTQPTAGCMAFDGSVADCANFGAITAPGMNVAGYNPTAGATAVSVPCQLNGGGAAGFAAEAAATMPLGACVRFDAGSGTQAALRNVRAIVARVTGGNVLGFAAGSLPIAPITSDVFYIEKPGVSQPSLQLGSGTSGHQTFQSTNPVYVVAGIESTGTGVNTSDVTSSELAIAFCWFTSLILTDSRLRAVNSYTHPVLGLLSNTGLSRCSTSFNATASATTFSGHVTTSYNITAPRSHSAPAPLVVGAGMNFTQPYVSSSSPTIGGTAALNGGVPPRLLDGGININGGGNFSVGQLENNATAVSLFTINGSGLFLDFSRAGANTSLTGAAAVAAGLNLGTGSPIPSNCIIRLDGNHLPQFTGALGQIYTTNLGNAMTWAQAVGSGNGFRDGNGNKFTNNGLQIYLANRFSGALFGAGGAVFTYLADNPQQAANNVIPINYPSTGFTASVLLVQPLVNTMTNTCTVTLYKNGVATSLVASIPAGSLARVNASLGALTPFFSANTVDGADGDVYDLRIDCGLADVGHTLAISASLGG